MTMTIAKVLIFSCSVFRAFVVDGLNILIPGGTGPLGQAVSTKLVGHDVTIMARNSFLAASPARVTNDFGWVGASFLNQNPHIKLRDWDGGDLLDIVGCDWIGWQEDSLTKADVIVHMVGGYTEQRVMACERLVRESLRYNRKALHITVSPKDDDLDIISPGMKATKLDRINRCELIVQSNCLHHQCIRLECNRIEQESQMLANAIIEVAKHYNR